MATGSRGARVIFIVGIAIDWPEQYPVLQSTALFPTHAVLMEAVFLPGGGVDLGFSAYHPAYGRHATRHCTCKKPLHVKNAVARAA